MNNILNSSLGLENVEFAPISEKVLIVNMETAALDCDKTKK